LLDHIDFGLVMTKNSDSDDRDSSCSFEACLGKLEQIARDLEEGDLGLDAALARYQEGVACLRECRRMLEQAERKIELLMGVSDSGQAVTAPFDDAPVDQEGLTAPEKAASRSRRRSAMSQNPAPRAADSASASEVDAEVDVDSPKRLF
jgi:exodeoxyribonuclease VII small subunit